LLAASRYVDLNDTILIGEQAIRSSVQRWRFGVRFPTNSCRSLDTFRTATSSTSDNWRAFGATWRQLFFAFQCKSPLVRHARDLDIKGLVGADPPPTCIPPPPRQPGPVRSHRRRSRSPVRLGATTLASSLGYLRRGALAEARVGCLLGPTCLLYVGSTSLHEQCWRGPATRSDRRLDLSQSHGV